MFWKTMAILWTVLLLILAGSAVQFVLTAQPGSSRVKVSPKGPARGTQATAFLTGVPSECSVLMPALLNLKSEQGAGKSGAVKLPKDLQTKSLKDLQRCLIVRRLTGKMVAIDVRGCKNNQQARELALAAANSYIRLVHKLNANVSGKTIERFTTEQNSLQKRLSAIRRQLAAAHRTSSMAMMQEKQRSLSGKLEMLAREILEAEDARSWTESAMKVHKEMQKDGSLADSPDVRLAVETDPIIRALRMRLVEVKVGLQALPAGSDKKSVTTSLEGEIKARRKEVTELQIEATGQNLGQATADAILRVMDLKERLSVTRSEARDADKALDSIESFRAEEGDLLEMISKIEDGLRKIRIGFLEGVPELIGVTP